jgi:hypothetical protein
MFGIFEKEGSWSRAFWKALKNYQNYQAETYLIMHLGLPTETQSIEDKRKKQVEEYKLAKKMLKNCGMSKKAINCLIPIGFMPSVKGVDSWKEFVPFD